LFTTATATTSPRGLVEVLLSAIGQLPSTRRSPSSLNPRLTGSPPRRGERVNVGSLFSGCGLLDYGLHLAGLEHAWLCEKDEFRRRILALRWPGVPICDDVRTVGPNAPPVDVIAGGFPCKGISSAGPQQGFGHPETALWR
jgi:hypothetical protein